MVELEERRPGITHIIDQIREGDPHLCLHDVIARAKDEWHRLNEKSDECRTVGKMSEKSRTKPE